MTNVDDDRLIDDLRAAMAEEVRAHHLDRPAAVAHALSAAHRRHPQRAYLPAIAASVVVVVVAAIAYLVTRDRPAASTPSASGSCAIEVGVLPQWARDGFSDPAPVMPYVRSDHGRMLAILWDKDRPLTAPPRADQNNKILWVSPDGGTPLVIHAHLGDVSTTRTVQGGPGPSIIDMPGPGCWTFELTWGEHHDTVRLPYGGR
jgi:hypothetical protein